MRLSQASKKGEALRGGTVIYSATNVQSSVYITPLPDTAVGPIASVWATVGVPTVGGLGHRCLPMV